MHVINFYDKNSKEAHWVSLFIDRNTAGYFNSFGTECVPPEVLNKIRNKSITHNIFRIQDNESIMCGKTLLDYTNLFSQSDYKRNDKIITLEFRLNK